MSSRHLLSESYRELSFLESIQELWLYPESYKLTLTSKSQTIRSENDLCGGWETSWEQTHQWYVASVRTSRPIRLWGDTTMMYPVDDKRSAFSLLYLTLRSGGGNIDIVRHCYYCHHRYRYHSRSQKQTRALKTTMMEYSHRSVQMGARVTIEWYHPERVINERLTVANSEKLTLREKL